MPAALPSSTVPAALSCHGLGKSFVDGADVVRAVRGFDLDLAPGELAALLGPSGCGKTTVLRLVAGLEAPDEGTIRLHGNVVAQPGGVVPAERRRVGLVFQDYALFPHLTVAQNVAYGLRRLDRSRRRARVADALELVGLTGEADRAPNALSGGQQQRVAIARALAPKPELLLLDEPFSNLDASLRSSVRSEVRRILGDAGITSLIVTHDQEEALSLADRVAVMADGTLHQVDTPGSLYQSPATVFVARFVGDADVLAATPLAPSTVATPLGPLDVDGSTNGVEQVMLRPEHLAVTRDDQGPATVIDVEFFGHDQLLRLRLQDGTEVRSRRGPGDVARVGDRVRVSVEGRVRAFGTDGRALTGQPATVAA